MHTEEEIIRRITRLLQKEFFEELTINERNELEDWLRSDPANREWYGRMKTLGFMEQDYPYYQKISEPGQAWKRLERDMKRGRGKYRWLWTCSAAAAILIIFSLSIFLNGKKEEIEMTSSSSFRAPALISLLVNRGQDSIQLEVNENIRMEKEGVRTENNTLIYDTLPQVSEAIEYHTLSVGRGGEYKLTLSDGTVVWLNSESALRYPVYFTGDQREVELWGEAFFDVSPDAKKTFRVKSRDFEVEVLGTSFNIMNYQDEQYAQVTLASGKLRVNNGEQHTIIRPNQQVQLKDGKWDVREIDSRYYISWIDNKFMFDDEPLEVIVRKLARWYNVDFEFSDSTLMKTRFSGQLLKYKDITKAFELLELTTDVDFSINPKKILIMRKKA